MRKRYQKDRNEAMGHLPEEAYLANPFVPFQYDNPPMYEARKGLIRGTMYPGLDLPFHNMVNRKEKPVTPMTQLQVLSFAIQELALYLDTHRDDKDALETYRDYQKMYQKCLQEYQQSRGAMNHRTPMEGPYGWLDDPWPWEYAKNQEG